MRRPRDDAELGARVPFANAHAGHDSFTDDQAVALFNEIELIRAATGAPAALPPHARVWRDDQMTLGWGATPAGCDVVCEIHRGRATASPWLLQRVIAGARAPALQLVADYSHFTVACEANPGDAALEAAIAVIGRRVRHVHARVGFDNGPQAPDPRAPEWAAHVAAHERWWDAAWDAMRAAGVRVATATPEHGPPPYQPTRPGGWGADGAAVAAEPLADIESVNEWLAGRLKERFQANYARTP